jgi:hypothetical protein
MNILTLKKNMKNCSLKIVNINSKEIQQISVSYSW